MNKSCIKRLLILLSIFCVLAPFRVAAQPSGNPLDDQVDLSSLSMEELMNVRITSVARKEQVIGDSTAAVFVLSKEDIRRSGATNIPDILRLVPGLSVAKNSSCSYAISARGFNSTFATKLLVMIDGRSVYSPLFAGVFWSSQDVFIEDIERIEVVRGPGASVWGSNAVNGVINIITSHAKDSQGLLVSARGGIEERAGMSMRYGGQAGENGFYRTYVKGYDRDDGITTSGERSFDASRAIQGGFRGDFSISESSDYTLQGDAYISNNDASYGYFSPAPPLRGISERINVNNGINILQRYSKRLFDNSDISFQMYYDKVERQEANIELNVDTLDLDIQHRFPLNNKHDILWGVGNRLVYDYGRVGFPYRMNGDETDKWFNLLQLFIQDEIEIIPNEMSLTLGTKLEHNDYTSLELQPNARFLIHISSEQSFWGAVARAVRIPSRLNDGARLDLLLDTDIGTFPALYAMMGNPEFKSEVLHAYELGYRAQLSDSLSFDLSVFFNDYSSIVSVITGEGSLESSNNQPYYFQPLLFSNDAKANALGGEVVVDWRPRDWLRLLGWYSLIDLNIEANSAHSALLMDRGGVSPNHQAQVKAQISLPKDIEFDVMTRFVDELPDLKIDAFVELDARLAWKPSTEWELALVGQNLLHDQQSQFKEVLKLESFSDIQRVVYVQATYRQ